MNYYPSNKDIYNIYILVGIYIIETLFIYVHKRFFSYILINNQVESVAPCWEYVVLQWCGTVVGVDDMARLQKQEM